VSLLPEPALFDEAMGRIERLSPRQEFR